MLIGKDKLQKNVLSNISKKREKKHTRRTNKDEMVEMKGT